MPRTRLYHESAPKGNIFNEPDEIQKALDEGWVEAPWLIGGKGVATSEAIEFSEEFENGIPDEPEPVIVKKRKRKSKKG